MLNICPAIPLNVIIACFFYFFKILALHSFASSCQLVAKETKISVTLFSSKMFTEICYKLSNKNWMIHSWLKRKKIMVKNSFIDAGRINLGFSEPPPLQPPPPPIGKCGTLLRNIKEISHSALSLDHNTYYSHSGRSSE